MKLLIPLIFNLTLLFTSISLHAMNPTDNKTQIFCDICNPPLLTLTFASIFSGEPRTPPIKNLIGLHCSITQRPAITIDAQAKLITIQCAFKEAGSNQEITVTESVPFHPGKIRKELSPGWRMNISITLPPDPLDR